MPFLENVLRGRNVPRERMLAVAEHYHHFDGRSPINDHNRALIAALGARTGEPRTCICPSIGAIAIGIRCSPTHCVRCGPTACVRRSRSSRPSLARTRAAASIWRISSGRARKWTARRRFTSCASSTIIRCLLRRRPMRFATRSAGVRPRSSSRAHSIPVWMAETSDYQKQLQEACRLVAGAVGIERLAAGLSEPQRTAEPAVAGAGHRGRDARAWSPAPRWLWYRSVSSPITSR